MVTENTSSRAIDPGPGGARRGSYFNKLVEEKAVVISVTFKK